MKRFMLILSTALCISSTPVSAMNEIDFKTRPDQFLNWEEAYCYTIKDTWVQTYCYLIEQDIPRDVVLRLLNDLIRIMQIIYIEYPKMSQRFFDAGNKLQSAGYMVNTLKSFCKLYPIQLGSFILTQCYENWVPSEIYSDETELIIIRTQEVTLADLDDYINDAKDWTLLSRAAREDCVDVVKLLLLVDRNTKTDWNLFWALDGQDKSALYYAMYYGKANIVKLFLPPEGEKSWDCCIQDKTFWIRWVLENGYIEVFEILFQTASDRDTLLELAGQYCPIRERKRLIQRLGNCKNL